MWIKWSRSSFIGNLRVFSKILQLHVQQESIVNYFTYYFSYLLNYIFDRPFYICSVRLRLLVADRLHMHARGLVPCMGNPRPLHNIIVDICVGVQVVVVWDIVIGVFVIIN